jgi:hypothetical protein
MFVFQQFAEQAGLKSRSQQADQDKEIADSTISRNRQSHHAGSVPTCQSQ